MAQINFRVDEEIKSVMDKISKYTGVSVPELAKRAVLKDISKYRVEIAFALLKEGKIARNRCWRISGLNHYEFLSEWYKRGAEEKYIEESFEKEIDLMKSIDLSKYLK